MTLVHYPADDGYCHQIRHAETYPLCLVEQCRRLAQCGYGAFFSLHEGPGTPPEVPWDDPFACRES